jgi:serine/threonine protein kinase
MDLTATRRLAEEAFHRYLALRDGPCSPPIDDFVASEPAEIREELREIFMDLGTCTQAFAADTELTVGSQVGDFKILRPLGSGGMAEVWEATQGSLGRRVALKILSPHSRLSRQLLERFQREAAAAARTAHRGIVAVYSVGENDGVHYIVQELVPGGRSLAHWIAEQREVRRPEARPYRWVARVIADAAGALSAAHAAGVVHRDVKPGNLLLTPDGTPKVADFGLARVEDALPLSRSGEVLGTVYYASPEQVLGQRDAIDGRSDVFSLGATLYEALCLRRPFEGAGVREVQNNILHSDPPDPRTLAPGLPWELAVICLTALEKRPGSRYASMADFAADLRRFLDHEPIRARQPSRIRRIRKWAIRHPLRASLAGVVSSVFLLCLFGVGRYLNDVGISARSARAAFLAGDLRGLRKELAAVPVWLGRRLLGNELAAVAPSLRREQPHEALARLVDIQAAEGDGPARLLAARYLQRDGFGAHPLLLRFLALGLELPAERGRTIRLVARLLFERPVATPTDVTNTSPLREQLLRMLHATTASDERVHVATALMGCGSIEDVPLLAAELQAAGAGTRVASDEEARILVLGMASILRRVRNCGQVDQVHDLDLAGVVTAAVHADQTPPGGPVKPWSPLQDLACSAAIARRAAGLPPLVLDSFVAERLNHERLLATQVDPGFERTLLEDPNGWLSREAFDYGAFHEYGWLCGCYDSLVGDSQLETEVTRIAAQLGMNAEDALAVFRLGRQEGAGWCHGTLNPHDPDDDTKLGVLLDPSGPEWTQPTVIRGNLSPDRALMARWTAIKDGMELYGAAATVEARGIRFIAEEWAPERYVARLGLPGSAELRLGFDIPTGFDPHLLKVHLRLQKANREPLPYMGEPALYIGIDDRKLSEEYVVHKAHQHDIYLHLPHGEKLGSGRHVLSIRLHESSNTTLRLGSAAVVAGD